MYYCIYELTIYTFLVHENILSNNNIRELEYYYISYNNYNNCSELVKLFDNNINVCNVEYCSNFINKKLLNTISKIELSMLLIFYSLHNSSYKSNKLIYILKHMYNRFWITNFTLTEICVFINTL